MQLVGEISLPGDKSISHRALMIASICNGKSKLINIPNSEDIKSTINVLQECGIKIDVHDNTAFVVGDTFMHPLNDLYCGNSGTTMRLMVGLLSGIKIKARFLGDKSLTQRPMGRIIEPLTKMGISINSNDGLPPLEIYDFESHGIEYSLDIESAQVKSSIILAALGIKDSQSKIKGKIYTRDHLEKILYEINSDCISLDSDSITINGGMNFEAFDYTIPGDISSAAYLIGLASLLEGSRLEIENILLNKTRLGFIRALKMMGANIKVDKMYMVFGEDVGRITVVGEKKLTGCDFDASMTHSMIDEIPILSLACSLSNGTSNIKGLSELKFKESDRLKGIKDILTRLGVKIKIVDDSILIEGQNKLYYTNNISSYNDHRLAMIIHLSQILSGVNTEYDRCIDISFPNFDTLIKSVTINQ